mmetsp:Transcript_6597/g.18931  ORF Transcript_6597/g.18931 Transcript_6597/m.18931 type:complete len:310 (-) Transcript_6597:1374-2303(-)|eukprot:CAMPEP_0172367112 /NCGR_PEP_ID=MMETSP1060-20121228/19228_1 /TAXON_ID=37318 /ORGANISM="Pseudo-nitzschia pungens, Strain cf. cingulata" /LENGTH=309 /DNA_ID=CAMNT_0013091229 /DNA_START=171 /DNA_END=1100 /DNA_ORIENTATION=-
MGLPTASSRAAAALAAAFVGPSPYIHSNGGGLRDGAIFSPIVADRIRNLNYNQPFASGYFTGRTMAKAHRQALILLDPTITTAAINFFKGMQFPAILVAGASLAGLFAMTEGVNDTSGLSKLQIFLLRLYHVTSLLSFCLSLSSIVTSATASTLLLLSEFSMVPKVDVKLGLDAYQLLRSNMNFEFLFTRWSFLVSVAFLFTSTAIRMLLQFELFKPKRRLAGWSVISTMTGVLTFIMGYANTTQHCWPSFWGLTREIFQIIWKRACINRQAMFLLSLASFAIGTLLTIKFLMPGTVEHDQLVDTDRYT